MKPTLHHIEKSNRRDSLGARHAPVFPRTDYNFQTASLPHGRGRSLGSPRPSFRKIGQGYFGQEARFSFVAEAAFFSVIVVTAAVSLIYSASALLQLVRSLSAF